jgi:DNA-binding SARP family transcriptional activator
MRGECYVKVNKLVDAINDLKEVLRKEPKDRSLYRKIIDALLQAQRYSDAKESENISF